MSQRLEYCHIYTCVVSPPLYHSVSVWELWSPAVAPL